MWQRGLHRCGDGSLRCYCAGPLAHLPPHAGFLEVGLGGPASLTGSSESLPAGCTGGVTQIQFSGSRNTDVNQGFEQRKFLGRGLGRGGCVTAKKGRREQKIKVDPADAPLPLFGVAETDHFLILGFDAHSERLLSGAAEGGVHADIVLVNRELGRTVRSFLSGF